MFLAPINGAEINSSNNKENSTKKINKEYIPQQIRLNKELKNIFTDNFNTI